MPSAYCNAEPAYLAALQPVTRRLQVEAGATVFRAGEAAEWVFRVLSGEVRLVRHTPQGTELVLSRARAGEFFAEAAVTAGGGRYHCSALATRRAELLAFPIPAFRQRLREDPEFALAWIGTLSVQLRRQRSAVERLGMPGAAERIRHYLLTEGEPPGTLRLERPLSAWADELGLSRETLYRALAALTRSGELERQPDRLRLLRS